MCLVNSRIFAALFAHAVRMTANDHAKTQWLPSAITAKRHDFQLFWVRARSAIRMSLKMRCKPTLVPTGAYCQSRGVPHERSDEGSNCHLRPRACLP